jgi:hypothetical protein
MFVFATFFPMLPLISCHHGLAILHHVEFLRVQESTTQSSANTGNLTCLPHSFIVV